MRKLLLLLTPILLAACTPAETARRWRVTVEVETPKGLVTGSGVVETRFRPRNELIYTLDSDQRRVLGEAIAVDVPGGVVFALLSQNGDYGFYRSQMNSFGWMPGPDGRLHRVQIYPTDTPETVAARAANIKRHDRSRAEIAQALAQGRPFELLEEGWPGFTFLRDPLKPGDAVLLAPTETHEAAVGDIRVRRIVVEETEEPITRTLARRFPWIARDWRGLPLSGRRVYPPEVPADLLHVDDFSRVR